MKQTALTFGKEPFTVLSYGGGQDSTAILLLCLFDAEFRNKYAPGELLIVMSDTGNEHPETYSYVKVIEELCTRHGHEHALQFNFLKAEQGYHPRTWPSLQYQMERNDTIMSKAFSKSCTDNLKIKPIYNYLEDYIHTRYGFKKGRKKAAYYAYTKMFGKLNVLLGIAAGEDSRIGNTMPSPWMNESLTRVYPLHEMGYDRAKCQEIIQAYGFEIPPPSNCMMCPWMSKQELLWLYRNHPDMYGYWVAREAAKMRKPVPEGKNNMGVFGKLALPQVLHDAIEQYGHWTNEQLNGYKMSHGHCVKSKY